MSLRALYAVMLKAKGAAMRTIKIAGNYTNGHDFSVYINSLGLSSGAIVLKNEGVARQKSVLVGFIATGGMQIDAGGVLLVNENGNYVQPSGTTTAWPLDVRDGDEYYVFEFALK